MRSQPEIIDMIDQIERDKSDPTGVQIGCLTRKLNWTNAQPYINKKYQDSREEKLKWRETSRVDPEALMTATVELIDKHISDWSDEDVQACLVNVQVLLVMVWLLGTEFEDMIGAILTLFPTAMVDSGEKIFKFVSKELGVDYDRLTLRYRSKKAGIILPGGNGNGKT